MATGPGALSQGAGLARLPQGVGASWALVHLEATPTPRAASRLLFCPCHGFDQETGPEVTTGSNEPTTGCVSRDPRRPGGGSSRFSGCTARPGRGLCSDHGGSGWPRAVLHIFLLPASQPPASLPGMRGAAQPSRADAGRASERGRAGPQRSACRTGKPVWASCTNWSIETQESPGPRPPATLPAPVLLSGPSLTHLPILEKTQTSWGLRAWLFDFCFLGFF